MSAVKLGRLLLAPARWLHLQARGMLAEHERAVRASLARWDDDAGDEGPLTLEGCVCGECFHCPDGWHWGDDLPCSCTPDCALGVEPDLFDSDDLGDYQATDFGDEGQP